MILDVTEWNLIYEMLILFYLQQFEVQVFFMLGVMNFGCPVIPLFSLSGMSDSEDSDYDFGIQTLKLIFKQTNLTSSWA